MTIEDIAEVERFDRLHEMFTRETTRDDFRGDQTMLYPSQILSCPRQTWFKFHDSEHSEKEPNLGLTAADIGTALHETIFKDMRLNMACY